MNIYLSEKIGFSGRSRSQQSSRENSVTRPIRETAQPPTLSREVSKGKIEENIHRMLVVLTALLCDV